MPPLLRPAAVPAAAIAAGVGALLLVRPGFVAQSIRSPLAWLTVSGVLLLVVGTRHVVRRLVGPRAAVAAGLVVVLGATLLLIGPSFRQRTLEEPLPAALQEPAVAAPRPPGASSTAPVAPGTPAAPAKRLMGDLRGIDHEASGRVVLYTGGEGGLVRFEGVDIEGSVGPSVHLVPAGSRRPAGGVRLGDLKAERGSFSYRVPAGVDLRERWTVLVWCDPYDVPIAAADPR